MIRLRPQKPAFTLIELLSVMGIMALLMAIAFPVIAKAKSSAQRTKAASHLRQIGMAYNLYLHSQHTDSAGVSSPQEWAATLAKTQSINNASLFYIDSDPRLAQASLPKRIFDTPSPHAATAKINSDFQAIPISYALVAQLAGTTDPSCTPIAWTRGLQENGHWASDSPYAGEGGHIVFLDGHVAWYEKLVNDKGQGLLHTHTQGAPTANIKETLPATAIIWESQ